MKEMLYILTDILFPIFALIVSGYLVQKKFHLDLTGFAKVQLYVFIPALMFINIVTSQLQSDLVLFIVMFTVILFVLLMVISYLFAKLFRLERKKEKAFMNAVTLRNQGNFGLPLMTLLYSEGSFGLAVHIIVLFSTNILLNTIGLYNASSGTYSKKEAIIKILKVPMIYVVVTGFLFKSFSVSVPGNVEATLRLMGQGVVPLALFTLGAQLCDAELKLSDKTLPVAVLLRLVASPLIAFAMVRTFGLQGVMAQVLVIGAAAPTAVNSVILAMEFDGDAEYASESVFLTTLLCLITVTITIKLAMNL